MTRNTRRRLSLPLSDDETVNIDKVRSLLWNASVSVFNPATWFLYDLTTRRSRR